LDGRKYELLGQVTSFLRPKKGRYFPNDTKKVLKANEIKIIIFFSNNDQFSNERGLFTRRPIQNALG